ncbi:MAG TPA: DoxX family protein [Alphaproteobacteria bacterium]|jgi:putative oxidoreductase
MALALTRILLSLLFAVLGFSKVIGLSGNNMQAWTNYVKPRLVIPGTTDPLPNPDLLAQLAAYGELIGGVMLFIGLFSRLTAFALLLFVIAATILGHAFWTFADAGQAYLQIQQFLKNLAIIGGLLAIVAYGGGGASIDAMFRRQPV